MQSESTLVVRSVLSEDTAVKIRQEEGDSVASGRLFTNICRRL